MEDYLFNAGLMSLSTYVGFAIGLTVLIFVIDKLVVRAVGKKEYKANKKIAKRVKGVAYFIPVLILIWGMFISFAGPQRTYKNETFDTRNHAAEIKRWNEADGADAADVVIEDEQRPDKFTTEERQERFDNLSDWRSGSKTGE